jgi:hypothetical protein
MSTLRQKRFSALVGSKKTRKILYGEKMSRRNNTFYLEPGVTLLVARDKRPYLRKAFIKSSGPFEAKDGCKNSKFQLYLASSLIWWEYGIFIRNPQLQTLIVEVFYSNAWSLARGNEL